jgi:phage shock protein A
MALLERVSTLLRANVNDLIDKAEDPEKMLRQLLLDMENQLLQVKTQVAIAIADQHLLEKKKEEHDGDAENWRRKAALAVQKGQDDLARAALARSLSHTRLSEGFAQQIEDQRTEAQTMRSNYNQLQQKLKETEARCELLIAQNRRARTVSAANKAHHASTGRDLSRSMTRMRTKVLGEEAVNSASRLMLQSDTEDPHSDALEDRFHKLEEDDRVEAMLGELKLLLNK